MSWSGSAASPVRPAVRWQGEFGQPNSLSIINSRVSAELRGDLQRVSAELRGDPQRVSAELRGDPQRVSAELRGDLQRVSRTGAELDGPLPHPADVEVRHQWPPDLSPSRAGALAAIVPWEFGAVPARWLEQIHRNVDELWVPSEYVRRMYLAGGIDPDRVRVIPNGVDLDVFHPAPSRRPHPPAGPAGDASHTRFLSVGGVIARKGPDVLLKAWVEAFAGRADVTLVIKDFGADGLYRGTDRSPIRNHAASGALPRIEFHEDTVTPEEMADLYRSADVLVAPYRGEGFAMPVLEAMACAVPVIATANGPSDEFCPPEAGWRIRSARRGYDRSLLPTDLRPSDEPWMLEPDLDDLVALLRYAAGHPDERLQRGAAGRRAAARFAWPRIAERYAERIHVLAAMRPLPSHVGRVTAFELEEAVELRLLATPAWKGEDRLDQLLKRWAQITTSSSSACLYLLADPAIAGGAAELEAQVIAAAAHAGADLAHCGDINLLISPHTPDRDERLHAAVTAYVPLHGGCAGQLRLAQRHHNRVYESLADLGAERVPAQ